MPSVSQIFGGLLVVAALLMAAHEIWLHSRYDAEGRVRNRARLRRRLTGVVFMLALVALLTWTGGIESVPETAKLRLILYGITFLLALGLIALAVADARAAGRQILRDMLGDDGAAMMENPQVRELMGKMSQGELSPEELERISAELEQSLPQRDQTPEG